MESNGNTVLTLEEAAEKLKISPEDVRKRIRLVTFTTSRDRRSNGEAEPREDTSPLNHCERLIARLENEVDYLRRKLDVRNEDLRRSDGIVLLLTQRLVELSAPK
ncbi:MAG: hypothetical protein M1358_23315 [Chloroflexi bacterium]|nr:hypothetical protein [Chloroflexota bacterium]